MTLQDFINAFQEIGTVAESGLKTADQLAKQYGATQVELPIEAAEMILPIVTDLTTKALNAFQGASKTPITVESVQALMPDPTPLPPPTE